MDETREYERTRDPASGKRYRRLKGSGEQWQEDAEDKGTVKSHGEDSAPPSDDSPHAKMMRAAAAAKKKREAQTAGAKAALAQ